MNSKKIENNLDLFQTKLTNNLQIPLMNTGISAGFPSPADDYIEKNIDLNQELIRNPSSTFLGRVKGLSMQGAGIDSNDILVIDKSLPVANGKIAVCYLNGEFTLKRIKITNQTIYLMPENPDYQPIQVQPENEFLIWGIVTYIIKKV